MNPGSKEAVEAGCSCPIFDNGQGEGLPWNGGRVWWINEDCPLHGIPTETEEEKIELDHIERTK